MITQTQKISLFLLRIALGWIFLYAGATQLRNPMWSAAGYLKSAHNFVAFYQWLVSPSVLPIINFVNEWGLTLLGLSLIFGIFVRLSSVLGIALMLLYYFVILQFPYPNKNSFIVDEHIIYSLGLFLLFSLRAGRVWGLENWCSKLPICSKIPFIRSLLG